MNITAADTCATVAEVLEAMCTLLSFPRLYIEGRQGKVKASDKTVSRLVM